MNRYFSWNGVTCTSTNSDMAKFFAYGTSKDKFPVLFKITCEGNYLFGNAFILPLLECSVAINEEEVIRGSGTVMEMKSLRKEEEMYFVDLKIQLDDHSHLRTKGDAIQEFEELKKEKEGRYPIKIPYFRDKILMEEVNNIVQQKLEKMPLRIYEINMTGLSVNEIENYMSNTHQWANIKLLKIKWNFQSSGLDEIKAFAESFSKLAFETLYLELQSSSAASERLVLSPLDLQNQ